MEGSSHLNRLLLSQERKEQTWWRLVVSRGRWGAQQVHEWGHLPFSSRGLLTFWPWTLDLPVSTSKHWRLQDSVTKLGYSLRFRAKCSCVFNHRHEAIQQMLYNLMRVSMWLACQWVSLVTDRVQSKDRHWRKKTIIFLLIKYGTQNFCMSTTITWAIMFANHEEAVFFNKTLTWKNSNLIIIYNCLRHWSPIKEHI